MRFDVDDNKIEIQGDVANFTSNIWCLENEIHFKSDLKIHISLQKTNMIYEYEIRIVDIDDV